MRDNGGAPRKREKKHATTTTNRATPAQRRPSKQRAHQDQPQARVRRTETRQGGCAARPGQGGHAHAHMHGTWAWRPPTRRGRCRHPHETAPVHRLSPPSKNGRYGKPDASVTGSTHTNHRSARSERLMLEGPARDDPIAGHRTATTRGEPGAPASAGASGRDKEPGFRPASTCPAQPHSKSGGASPCGGERHHGVGTADRSTESDRSGRGAAHQRGATRHAREARRRPQPRHTDSCQATTATGCRKPGQRAQHATNHGTGTGARQHPTHKPETAASSGGVQAERPHKHTATPTPQPGAGRSVKPEPKHTHPHRTFQVGRRVGALGRGEAPQGSPWRRPCDEQQDALRLKRGGDFHPARPNWWPPAKRPRATGGGLIAASVTYLFRREDVPPCLRTSPPLGGTLGVHRTSWRIPFPMHACTFLVLGFRGAWVSHAPPRVPKHRRP